MNYPNNINKNYHKKISYSNRGMDLEDLINETNKYYLEIDKALIYKKPTPIGIDKVSFENNSKIITKAYFKEPSTLDYNGLYKGRYVEFEAKETQSKTAFPLSNIHKHQIDHLKKVILHNGIGFLIIRMNNVDYYLDGKNLLLYINNNDRKSIPYEYIVDNGYELKYNYNKGINYLDIVDKLYFDKGDNYGKEK